METATTLAVAEHFRMESAGVLFVFDNLRESPDIVIDDGVKGERRKTGNRAMIDATLKIVQHHLATTG